MVGLSAAKKKRKEISMAKHCPICNRSSDEFKFYGEFCEVCTREMVDKKLPKEIHIDRCRVCKRIRLGNSFVEENDASIEEELRHALSKYEVKLRSYNQGVGVANVSIATEVSGERLVLDKRISIKYNRTICKQCSRRLGGYFEAIFQIRGSKEKVENFKNSVKNFFEANNEFVTKEEEVNGGVDLYLSSKKLASNYLSMFRIKANTSYTLHTVKNGKKLYRNTYSIQLGE
ncbi:MAG: NMD3-related protein [Candidatus Micrarchaeia archaeon]|jgi:NMD protein affecting ribosome stability and mRNA decay